MRLDNPFELERFVEAQAPVYSQVIAELATGRKRTHWMWFVFPQMRGLGSSGMAVNYGISGVEEAQAYLAHGVLGPRIEECTRLVNAVEGRTLREIFSTPDDLKFRSSMTLFARAAPENPLFTEALRKYCGGVPDPATIRLLD